MYKACRVLSMLSWTRSPRPTPYAPCLGPSRALSAVLPLTLEQVTPLRATLGRQQRLAVDTQPYIQTECATLRPRVREFRIFHHAQCAPLRPRAPRTSLLMCRPSDDGCRGIGCKGCKGERINAMEDKLTALEDRLTAQERQSSRT